MYRIISASSKLLHQLNQRHGKFHYALVPKALSTSDKPHNKSKSFWSLLQPEHLDIIQDEKEMLTDLLRHLKAADVPRDQLELVADTRSRIDDLFMIVIVGEFNAGKSTLINTLIGSKLLKVGVLPTTAKICIIRNDDASKSPSSSTGNTNTATTTTGVWKRPQNILLDDVEEIELPIPWLQHIAIVDTPGTNAIIAKHEELTQKIVPRADLVLFVTSAERPMSESESELLSRISEWGKKVVVVVNKVEILLTQSDKDQVMDFVAKHASSLLGIGRSIPVFGVSSRLALNAKLVYPGSDPALGTGAKSWEESNFHALETYLKNTLGKEDLIRNKLENPLGVADRIIAGTLEDLERRHETLESDKKVLEMIDENMVQFKRDIERDVKFYKQHVQLLLGQVTQRSDSFFERNISIFNPRLLADPALFQEEFKREVLMDVTKPIDDLVIEISNLLSQRARTQSRSVMDYVGTRPKHHSGTMIGSVVHNDGAFDASRLDLIDKLRRDVKTVLVAHDHSKHVELMSTSVRDSLYQSAALQGASAVTVGGLVAAHLLDITGIVAASSAVLFGFFIVPQRKAAVKENFSKRIETMQTQIDTVIANNLERELRGISDRISDAIAPYSRFVEIETKKVAESMESMKVLRTSVRDLRKKLG